MRNENMKDMNEVTMTSSVEIVRKENIATIINNAPASYEANRRSHDNCVKAGRLLLGEIEAGGMTDELDRRAAAFIEKTRKTVKKMNETRSAVTRLFDTFRSEFTALENGIDPAKAGTPAYQLQQQRNHYAAKKRAEEEARRRAEAARMEKQRARDSYRQACEEDYRQAFNRTVTQEINRLTDLDARATLENIQAVADTVESTGVELPGSWQPQSAVHLPMTLTPDECRDIRSEVMAELRPKFEEQYRFEIGDLRADILARLPSKKLELERVAKADAEEAERMKADMAAREAAEAARKEKERQEKEAAERQKAELERRKSEMAGLFDQAEAQQAYQPKAKVTKRIVVTEARAYLNVVNTWWQHEGCRMTADELAQVLKKQVTLCEKLDNKEGIFIQAEGLEYVDEVKAK